MDRRIIIRIAFNVFLFTKKRFEKEWIAERMKILQHYTLRSLRNQENQNFIAYIEYDHRTRNLIFDELSKYPPLPNNIFFVENADRYIYKEIRNYRFLFLVRLDSDDMYCKGFINTLMNYSLNTRVMALICQQGYIYDIKNKRLGIYLADSPPFYVLIYKAVDYLKGRRYRLPNGHPDVIKLQHKFLPAFSYMVTVHDRNSETTFSNSYYTKAIIKDQLEINQILQNTFGVKDGIYE